MQPKQSTQTVIGWAIQSWNTHRKAVDSPMPIFYRRYLADHGLIDWMPGAGFWLSTPKGRMLGLQ